MLKNVKIASEPRKTEIFIGEMPINGVVKMDIAQEVGMEIPAITLTCLAPHMDMEIEMADIKFAFPNNWIMTDRYLPEQDVSVLALVRDKQKQYHCEVLSRMHVPESDAIYEGVYWCSYRTINIEAFGMQTVVAWQPLPPAEDIIAWDNRDVLQNDAIESENDAIEENEEEDVVKAEDVVDSKAIETAEVTEEEHG